MTDIISNATFAAKFGWLVQYMDYLVEIQSQAPVGEYAPSTLLPSANPTTFRYNLSAFFVESQHISWPVTANYTLAGQPEAFIPFWQHAFANPTEITTDVVLNAPYKEGYTFNGWYTNAACTGTPITILTPTTSLTGGILYAKWGVYIPTIEEINVMEDNTITKARGTVSMVVGSEFWIQDVTGGIICWQTNHGLAVGEDVTFSATKVTYGGIPELKNITVESHTAGTPIQPQNATLNQLFNYPDAYISKLVHVEGLMITEYDPYHYPTFSDGINSIVGYRMTLDETAYPVGTKVHITAILDSYNGSLQFRGNPENVEFVSLPEQPDPDPDPNPERDTYNLTLSVNNPQVGIVTGAGTYAKNARIYIDAFPINSAYKFSHWSDGKTESSRYITMTRDYNLTAYFDVNDGLENTLMNTEQPVRIYTITGQEVTDHSGSLPRGIYIIQTGDKVQKIFVP